MDDRQASPPWRTCREDRVRDRRRREEDANCRRKRNAVPNWREIARTVRNLTGVGWHSMRGRLAVMTGAHEGMRPTARARFYAARNAGMAICQGWHGAHK